MDFATTFVHSMLQTAFAVSPVNVDATATYQFNPSMSQEEGCKRAEEKAKTLALRKAFGQDFGTDSTMSCRETDKHKCESITNTYENTRGYIQSLSNRTEKVEGWSCTVNLTASMMQLKKRTTTLEAQATLDRVVYTSGDRVKLKVETNTRGMVSVFQYDPVSDRMSKVYPSTERDTLWTHGGYPLSVNLPFKSVQERDTPYYYFVTVTGGPIPTMSNYRLHEFYQMWDNLPYNDVTFVRKSFYVSRSNL